MREAALETIEAFTGALASAEPTPGGGGAAAMAGALGAALCAMAGRLTIGKRKYAGVEAEIRDICHRADRCGRELLGLIDQDAAAFAPLRAAWGIPREQPGRQERLRLAGLEAAKAPLRMMDSCAAVTELLERMLEIGSSAMISDVGCGALLCRAALEAAAMNVYVNTRALPEDGEAQALAGEADRLLKDYGPRAGAVAQRVMEELRGERSWL